MLKTLGDVCTGSRSFKVTYSLKKKRLGRPFVRRASFGRKGYITFLVSSRKLPNLMYSEGKHKLLISLSHPYNRGITFLVKL